MKRHTALILTLIAASIALFFVLNLVLGSVAIPLRSIVHILFGTGEESEVWRNIVWKSRVPQSLTALVAGAGLAVSGLQMQTVFRNPLAGPSVLGISRAMPLSTGGQLVLMSLAGIAIFGEWLHGGALPYGIAAIIVLIVGIWFLSRSESGSDAASLDWKRGAFLLTTSTLGLVAFPLIIKWFGIQPAEFLLPQAIGYTAYCGAFFAIQGRGGVDPEDSLRHRRMVPSIFNGVLWGIAILLLQLNSNKLGAGTGFTLSQLGILISTPLGILWLHETRSRKELRWTIIGVTLVIVGAVLAGVAKTLDVA